MRSVVLLDDLEGFTIQTRQELAALLAKEDRSLAPVVVTCNQRRDQSMRSVASFAEVRLSAPSEHICREWFLLHHVWEHASLADGPDEAPDMAAEKTPTQTELAPPEEESSRVELPPPTRGSDGGNTTDSNDNERANRKHVLVKMV